MLVHRLRRWPNNEPTFKSTSYILLGRLDDKPHYSLHTACPLFGLYMNDFRLFIDNIRGKSNDRTAIMCRNPERPVF